MEGSTTTSKRPASSPPPTCLINIKTKIKRVNPRITNFFEKHPNARLSAHAIAKAEFTQPTNNLTKPATDSAPDLLGRFVTSTIIGPRNQAISVITAYWPVQIGSRVNPVIQQHKRVLGQNSHPCCQLLQDLANVILTLHRKEDEIILAMDASKKLPQQPNIIWNDFETFYATTGLMDAMTALHGYATIPSR